MPYLELKKVQCKDCYLCLRECPVKAISFADHRSQIIEDRCILCGRCMHVCPQDAKLVHTDLDKVRSMLSSGKKLIASVAPSFIPNLGLTNFEPLRQALKAVGFAEAEETARGAEWVTHEYARILKSGTMKNFITTACPSACRLVQEYFPQALPYLAPVASPMVAHARLLHAEHPDAEVVFIGPCLAKRREAAECGEIAAVLTFDELASLGLTYSQTDAPNEVEASPNAASDHAPDAVCKAKGYPVTDGIIKSFPQLPAGYHYMSVDGPKRAMEVLENIDNYEGVFIEINICPGGCINGPFSHLPKGGTTMAKLQMQQYQSLGIHSYPTIGPDEEAPVDFSYEFPRVLNRSRKATDKEIEEVLRRTGKVAPEDELNCGACGYRSCRGKAWAVLNGYADIEMCLPYMRKKAEAMAYDIVHNSPEGILLVDGELNVVDANITAMEMLDIPGSSQDFKPRPLKDFMPPLDFYLAYSQQKNMEVHKQFIVSTKRYVDITICYMKDQNLLFGQMKDVTEEVNYEKRLDRMRDETIETTDEVIMKQMRVAQEIASLLGETTAETKVALLNLKKILRQESAKKEE